MFNNLSVKFLNSPKPLLWHPWLEWSKTKERTLRLLTSLFLLPPVFKSDQILYYSKNSTSSEMLIYYLHHFLFWESWLLLKEKFLKTVIMQSQDWGKYLRICSNLALMNVKHEKLALTTFICHNFTIFFLVSHVFI